MGPHIDSLKIGETLELKGPIPKYPYTPNIKKSIGLVAGGTGIAPMIQVGAIGGLLPPGSHPRRSNLAREPINQHIIVVVSCNMLVMCHRQITIRSKPPAPHAQ